MVSCPIPPGHERFPLLASSKLWDHSWLYAIAFKYALLEIPVITLAETFNRSRTAVEQKIGG